jgi:hypothetical protein
MRATSLSPDKGVWRGISSHPIKRLMRHAIVISPDDVHDKKSRTTNGNQFVIKQSKDELTDYFCETWFGHQSFWKACRHCAERYASMPRHLASIGIGADQVRRFRTISTNLSGIHTREFVQGTECDNVTNDPQIEHSIPLTSSNF